MTSNSSSLFQPLMIQAHGSDQAISEDHQSSVILTDFTVFHKENSKSGSDVVSLDTYQAGYEAGLAKAQSDHVNTVKAMEQSLQHLGASFQKIRKDIEVSHSKVVLMCLDAVLSSLAPKTMRYELEGLIKQAAAASLDGVFSIYCHPDNVSAKTFLDGCTFDVTTRVVDDPELTSNEIFCEWEGGQASIDPDAIISAFEAVLSPAPET